MGALSGYKVIELAGIGPAPMGGMILRTWAEVIRIERPGAADPKVAEPISGRNKNRSCWTSNRMRERRRLWP